MSPIGSLETLMAQVHWDCVRSFLIILQLYQQTAGVDFKGVWMCLHVHVCDHMYVFALSNLFCRQIYCPSVLCKPTAQHLPTLFPLDRRHWVDNVRFQHQEGIALLQYLASYFCFLQHFPDALLVIFYVVEVNSIFFFSFQVAILLLLLSALSLPSLAQLHICL